MPLPAAPKLVLSKSDRKQLLEIWGYRSTPRGIALRVEIILSAADGIANHAIARNLDTSLPTVLLWRKRYRESGMVALLEDLPRSGRPKQISEQTEASIVHATIKTKPPDATHWSVRAMAASQKVSAAIVQRVWKKHRFQPHRLESFKFSSDPDFAPKVRDIVGLYLNPPDKAIILI